MSDKIENIFIDLLFPKTKHISIGIIYKLPVQTQFLEQTITEFQTLYFNNNINVLGDFNINLLFPGKCVLNKTNGTTKINKDLLIYCPTRITCNTSALTDHILTNTQDNISQSGIIDTAILDHCLIYCTRKILKAKCNRHKEITFRSLKNYSTDVYKGTLERVSSPNYENFDNPDIAYSDFITWLNS